MPRKGVRPFSFGNMYAWCVSPGRMSGEIPRECISVPVLKTYIFRKIFSRGFPFANASMR
jgi:hypothetical protein